MIKRKIIQYGLFLLLLLGFVFVIVVNIFNLEASDIFNPCIFHKITGLYCPGCGMTRATIFLAKGNILASIYHNPTILYVAIISVWSVLSYIVKPYDKKQKYNQFYFQYKDIYIWIGLVLLLGTFVIRNILSFFFKIWII